jgi:hypothetical protein
VNVRRRMKGAVLSMSLASLSFAAAGAEPPTTVSAAALANCAGIAASDERLACYDALAGRVPSRTETVHAAAPSVVTAKSIPAAAAQTASAAVPAGQTGDAPPVPNPPDPADAKNFGLTPHQLKKAPEGPEQIQAVVNRLTEDRAGNVYVVLDNAQTWVLNNLEGQLRPGDPVTIKRAALGSFLMLTPDRRRYRVQRLP